MASTPRCRCSARWCATPTCRTATTTSTGWRNSWPPAAWSRKASDPEFGRVRSPVRRRVDGAPAPPHPSCMSNSGQTPEITPQILLRAYSVGMFPMAEGADDPTLFWVDPDMRGIFPLDRMIISKSLAKTLRNDLYEVRIDEDFDAVIDGCAAATQDRPNTWINQRIRRLYRDLFDFGFVHTVEVFSGRERVGG